MRKHVKACWGEDALAAVDKAGLGRMTANEVRKKVIQPLKSNGTITAAFKRSGKELLTFSHTPHTSMETR